MRVLQLIDSLQAGGAERVAVNIANALSRKITSSHLCATRDEGLLKQSLSAEVGYLFLNKKKAIDLKAIKGLLKYINTHKIDLIHAHSSSFFLAVLIKIFKRNIKIVWHDHYGKSEYLEARDHKILKFCSRYFAQIFSVNLLLEIWAKKHLKCKNVSYLPNFAVENTTQASTILKGDKAKRIIHLANLRAQKDHFTLIKAFKLLLNTYPDWTLHCVGKDFEDDYSKAVHNEIQAGDLKDKIFVYGSKSDVSNILTQSDIAVLSSKSEGLPIALLEYGLAALPVIATNVGNCKDVIIDANHGVLINSEDIQALEQALVQTIANKTKAQKQGLELNKLVQLKFSEQAIIKTISAAYKSIETRN